MDSKISTPTPIPTDGEQGTLTIVSQWTRMDFLFPFNQGIVGNMSRESSNVFQADAQTLPQWGPNYPSGSVGVTYEEILALPSADAFFGELFALADLKLTAREVVEPVG